MQEPQSSTSIRRNPEAESEVRRRLHVNQVGGVDVEKAWPAPASPLDALSVTMSPSDPATARGLTGLLQTLTPSRDQLRSVTRMPTTDLYLRATKAGIDPHNTNVLGEYNHKTKSLYVDPDLPAQNQYDVLLHELVHAAGQGEGDAQAFERRYNPRKDTPLRPSWGGGPGMTSLMELLRPGRR